jgi:glucose-6-phosphate isomerase, archaeal
MLWQLEEIKHISPDVRILIELKEIVFDKRWLQRSIGKMRDEELYSLYKDVFKPEDEAAIRKSGLRYDILVIPALMMGEEYVKTAGHYNPIAFDEMSYPEVYQVLEGEALFLIQKVDNFDRHNLVDVAFAKAKAGEVFVVPPNFGQVIINASKKRVVLARWIADGFEPIYEPIERMCGAAYFFTNEGWVRNQRYGLIPQLREIKCKKLEDMYLYVSDLKRLSFLKNPNIRPEKTEIPKAKESPEPKEEAEEVSPEPQKDELNEDSPENKEPEEKQTFVPVDSEEPSSEHRPEAPKEEPQPKKDRYRPIGF